MPCHRKAVPAFLPFGKWPEPTLASAPRYCLEGLPAEPLPGLPSPRLTFTGQFRAGKAPEVLAMALALLAAPPPAYLVGDCPTRQAVIRLVAGLRGRTGWTGFPAGRMSRPLRGGASVHLVPSRQEAWS